MHVYVCVYVHVYIYARASVNAYVNVYVYVHVHKDKGIFHKRATKYRALLRKMTYKDNAYVNAYVYVHVQGGEDSQDPLPLQVIFRKRALYLVALLWKMICNLGDPMSLRHPVITGPIPYYWTQYMCVREREKERERERARERDARTHTHRPTHAQMSMHMYMYT